MTPPAVKISPCQELVKDEKTLIIGKCGKSVSKGMSCSNRAEHMSRYKTGFCANGDCEGKATKGPVTGKPKMTCKFWKTCPCQCHISYDQMFAMSDMERHLVDNSGYEPPKGEFWMPSPEDRMAMIALSTPAHAPRVIVQESPAPNLVPASIVRSYAPTATGRAAPGELESWTKQECDVWLVESLSEKYVTNCTPAFLAEEIGKSQGIKPPSVGAITAIFIRWQKLGFAVIGAKPARFIEYTPQGIKLGLEGCKELHKRKRKSAEASAGRRIGKG